MVGEDLARDLLSFGTHILVLGDPAQLPPVKGEGYFINAEPDVMLTEIHRQARDNPTIRMSMDIREGKRLTPGSYGDSLVVRAGSLPRPSIRNASNTSTAQNQSACSSSTLTRIWRPSNSK